jgi:hypothetical protein
MSKGKSDKITYKPYKQHQVYLIPPSAEELIPKDHLVRLVSEVTDEMRIEQLLRKYQVGSGEGRYHPIMMTKLFVYGYMTKVCSSRMPAKAVETNNKKLDAKLGAYLQMADEVWEEEDGEYGNRDLEELGGKEGYTGADVKALAGILPERMDDEGSKKKMKKELKTIEKEYLPGIPGH